MARLIRMDRTGHSVLARWTAADPEGSAAAQAVLQSELDDGYIAVLAQGPGQAEQIRELPLSDDDALVILRRPIAGG